MLPLPGKPPFSPTSTYWLNARAVYFAARQHGAQNPFAIGILANLDMESAFRTSAVGDNGTAFNMAQWHTDRVVRILSEIGINLQSEIAIPRVMYALFWEMAHVEAYSGAYNQMQAAKTAEDAAELFCRYIEGAGAADAAKRRAEDAAFWTAAIAQHADFFALPAAA